MPMRKIWRKAEEQLPKEGTVGAYICRRRTYGRKVAEGLCYWEKDHWENTMGETIRTVLEWQEEVIDA